mmetsp:Transcript_11824/g.18754  ORF Transcript_11824/g.18754 Transcript_11824/m.18754 type:complete len:243 (-) Transcript_11824:186-914(-)
MQNSQTHALGIALRALARVMSQSQIIRNHEITPFPLHSNTDFVQFGFDLGRYSILDDGRVYHSAYVYSIHNPRIVIVVVFVVVIASVGIRFIAIPTRDKWSTAMKQHGHLTLIILPAQTTRPKRMSVHQRMNRTLPPPRGHPNPIQIHPLLLPERLVQFLQRHEVRIAPLGHARKVHGLIRERTLLKGPVRMPSAPSYRGASLPLVVRYAEYIRMRRSGMFVECRLDATSQCVADFDLTLSR